MAKQMKSMGMGIEDLRSPYINAVVLKQIGIDLHELLDFYNALKDRGSGMVKEIIQSVQSLRRHGLSTGNILNGMDDAMKRKSDLDQEIERMMDDLDGIKKETNDASRFLESEKSGMDAVSSDVERLRGEKLSIEKEISNSRMKISLSEKFWEAANSMGLEPERITAFAVKAKILTKAQRRSSHSRIVISMAWVMA